MHTSKHTLFFILPFLVLCNDVFSQEIKDGIYFKLDEKKCIYKKVSIKNSRSLACIPENPVLLFEDIISISDLEIDLKTSNTKLLIKLSENGSSKLAAISEFYLGEELAFVFNNKVVFLLKVDRIITTGIISLEDNLEHSSLLDVRKAIEEVLLRKADP